MKEGAHQNLDPREGKKFLILRYIYTYVYIVAGIRKVLIPELQYQCIRLFIKRQWPWKKMGCLRFATVLNIIFEVRHKGNVQIVDYIGKVLILELKY